MNFHYLDRMWKSLGLNDDDLKRLQEEIILDLKIGAVMKETGGIRKMRKCPSDLYRF